MNDRKKVNVNPSLVEIKVTQHQFDLVIYDSYRETRKQQIEYALKDLSPWMVAHLIKQLAKGMEQQRVLIAEDFKHARIAAHRELLKGGE